MSQTDCNLSRKRCAQRAARQRRIHFVVNTLAGAMLSMGVLATLQAASDSGEHLSVQKTAHGGSSRLLAGVNSGGFAADALPYSVLANLVKPAAVQVKASEPLVEPDNALPEEPEADSEALADAQAARDEAVLAAIEQWAKAWRSKDVAGYLAAYGKGFQPANGISRDDWAKQRQQRIADKRVIQLDLRDIEVQAADADRVRVNFVQDYRADQFVEKGTAKSLLLALEKDGWRILAEESAR
jgi:hypothetical protein